MAPENPPANPRAHQEHQATAGEPATVGSMRPGQKGTVQGFHKGERDYRQRLLSMGLTPGTGFTVSRVAPLGDPVELVVRGFSLTLRRSEAEMLKVVTQPAGEQP